MDFKIEKVAELARLNLTPAEKENLSRDLEKILGHIESLASLNTDHVLPTSHVLDMENVFRPDEPIRSGKRDQALKHAPMTEGPFFKVPKVVDR